MSDAASKQNTLFTIGHSNHELDAFIALLQSHRVTAVGDVRSRPYSRYLSQYNRETLDAALANANIKYLFLGDELGARRAERECYVNGQACYDRIAQTPAFTAGIARVLDATNSQRIALMCAEKDPLTCHRTILVCRHLRNEGMQIEHILDDGSLESMDDAETRLLELMRMPERDLFRSRDELLDEAYEKQATRIAFTETRDQADEFED